VEHVRPVILLGWRADPMIKVLARVGVGRPDTVAADGNGVAGIAERQGPVEVPTAFAVAARPRLAKKTTPC